MSDKPFNGLTPAQAERLAMLAEECGEVIQIVGKILRHGLDSHNPNAPQPSDTNRVLLRRELIDIIAVGTMLTRNGDMDAMDDAGEFAAAISRKLKYSHHQ